MMVSQVTTTPPGEEVASAEATDAPYFCNSYLKL